MDLKLKEDQSSDDEIFYGELSLKEIKQMFISNKNHRQTIAITNYSEEDTNNKSLQLISTHSEPDVTSGHSQINILRPISKAKSNLTLSPNDSDIFATWDITSSENSFLKFEKMIEESCESPNKEVLDNTLEAIENILRNEHYESSKNEKTLNCEQVTVQCEKIIPDEEPNYINGSFESKEVCSNSFKSPAVTPIKQKSSVKEVYATPSSVLMTTPSLLKTPAKSPFFKKPLTSSVKKTPSRNNAFKHIASPVAYYIKNSPQVPLIQNVIPKKPIFGSSSIPKLVKSNVVMSSCKENVNLPQIAYKSAKKTTVVDVSNGPKLPQSQWAKKLTRSLPKPAVTKHTHREKEFINKPLMLRHEDSFGDLSLHQADISVHTKKAAF